MRFRRLAALVILACSVALASARAGSGIPGDACAAGASALRSGQLEVAASNFLECTASSPDVAEAHFNLGLVRLQQGRSADAWDSLSRALKIKPNLRGGNLFLGIAAYRLDRFKESVAALSRATAQEPNNGEAVMWLGMAQLGNGDSGLAVQSLEKASKLKPNDVDIFYHLGKAYMQLSKQTYERMYQADPNSWRIHQVLADSFEQADRLDDAAKESKLALSLKPSEPGLHQQLGEIYQAGNHLEEAEGEFKSELKISPQNFAVMYKLATVLIERSNAREASELLTQVGASHPESRPAHYQLGRAYVQLGDNESAIREFSAVVKGSGSVDAEVERQSYYQLAQLYRRVQRPEEARLALTTFLRLKQDADAQRNQKLEDKLKRSTDSEVQ